MSLITRCPVCQTLFKVVPDQLKISEGWVRCGVCEEIFDAAAHMQQELATESPAPKTRKRRPESARSAKAPTLVQAAAKPASPGQRANNSKANPQVHAEPSLAPASARTPAPSAPAPPDIPTQPMAPTLSFMQPGRRSTRWHHPLVRTVLALLALILVLTLALQWVIQERDGIVAREPALRPWVEELCLQVACAVRPLKQIESVVIDSSSFLKVKGDLYRLSLTLKNTAPIDLAMPAVELALTDRLDQPLIRRVLLPEELGVRDGVIRAAAESQAALMLTIKSSSNERIAGYRLLAFYP